MRTVLVCNHKGGVGKTSVALHLAAFLAQEGETVAAVDTDPQGSLTQWHARSRAEGWGVPDVYMLRGPELLSRLPAFAKRRVETKRIDTLIIDTPPAFSGAVVELADKADLVLVPVTPGGFELDALQTTLAMGVREKMRFILNRADNGLVCREVRRYLDGLGPVCVVRNYAVFREASLAGGTVLALEPGSNAARDIRALAKEALS